MLQLEEQQVEDAHDVFPPARVHQHNGCHDAVIPQQIEASLLQLLHAACAAVDRYDARQLTQLIAAATDSRVRSALTAARDELIGNHTGTPPTNGALDKLEADNPVDAITKLKAAIAYLATAEARGAGNLASLKDLGGLIAVGREGIPVLPFDTPGMYRAFVDESGAVRVGIYRELEEE